MQVGNVVTFQVDDVKNGSESTFDEGLRQGITSLEAEQRINDVG
jgi:hypothetical protein